MNVRSLQRATWSNSFSTLDMKIAYHQVEEEHKKRTEFLVGPLGLYEYCKMLFGFANSPAT